MRLILRPLLAEFVATFAFVFIGAGAVVVDSARGGELSVVGVALAHGLAFAVVVTMTLNISGGHVNPAVTFGLWLGKRIDGKLAGLYVVAQLAGAALAAIMVRSFLPDMAGEVTGYGSPRISGLITTSQAIGIEALLTFVLVSVVFGTAVSREAPPAGGFAIGTTVLAAMLVAGPLTGAVLNPARAFGPALVAGAWQGHAVWWIGPLLGGAVAGGVWRWGLLPTEEA
jgi:aquaporin Z